MTIGCQDKQIVFWNKVCNFLKKQFSLPTPQKNSEILSSAEGKAVIRQYNKISYMLVEFEVVYHAAWVKEISQLQYGASKVHKWGLVSNEFLVLLMVGIPFVNS